MQMRLSREDFELVAAVSSTGTLTKAAQSLHLSQSALSHHLRALEGRVGGPIFHRLPRKLVPTEIGKQLLIISQDMVKRFREAEQLIELKGGTHPQVFWMATECYTAYSWLPAFLRWEELKGLNIQLQIAVDATPRVRHALCDGSIDFAILNSTFSDGNLELVPLFQDEMVLAVSKTHRFAGKSVITASQLEDEMIFFHTAPGVPNTMLDRFLKPEGISPKSASYIPLTEAIVEMVGANLGVAAFARWLIEPYAKQHGLQLLRCGSSGLHREWYIGLRSNDPRRSLIQQLAAGLKMVLAKRKTGAIRR